MQLISYDDLEQMLYYHADDLGFLNKNQIVSMYNLKVPVSLHVEDFLDFYYWDLTKQLLEKNGNLHC